jgi:hypothetical protein
MNRTGDKTKGDGLPDRKKKQLHNNKTSCRAVGVVKLRSAFDFD